MTFRQLKFYLQANWIKTLYFNFKMLPFNQAKKMPILLFGKCKINCGKFGKIISLDGEKPFASVLIGNSFTTLEPFNSRPLITYIAIRGTLYLNGIKQTIGNGCKIVVEESAYLTLGDHVIINNSTKLCCQHEIYIGNTTTISWDCQIFDTNFHYIMDQQGRIGQKYGRIFIGENCWIGNRCTIQKNTYLNNLSTLASNSLINRNFSDIECGTFAGSPAKLVTTGKMRARNAAIDIQLDKFFIQNPDVTRVQVDVEEAKKYFSSNDLNIHPI